MAENLFQNIFKFHTIYKIWKESILVLTHIFIPHKALFMITLFLICKSSIFYTRVIMSFMIISREKYYVVVLPILIV